MSRLIYKIALYLIPFALFYTVIAVIDPYDWWGPSRLIKDAKKVRTMNSTHSLMATNNGLWKLLQFKREPKSRIILGDSRPFSLDYEYIRTVSGKEFFNFGIPGGNVKSIIDSFWYTANVTKLDEVYIGISFHTFSSYCTYDILAPLFKLVDNPISYITDHIVIESSIALVNAAFAKPVENAAKKPSKHVIWGRSLEKLEAAQKYGYPTSYLSELRKIADYCKKNGIALRFVVFPTHAALQRKYDDLKLTAQKQLFIEDLKQLAVVYDFDFINETTEDIGNFNDPLHATREINKIVVDRIWSSQEGEMRGFVRVYPPRKQ